MKGETPRPLAAPVFDNDEHETRYRTCRAFFRLGLEADEVRRRTGLSKAAIQTYWTKWRRECNKSG